MWCEGVERDQQINKHFSGVLPGSQCDPVKSSRPICCPFVSFELTDPRETDRSGRAAKQVKESRRGMSLLLMKIFKVLIHIIWAGNRQKPPPLKSFFQETNSPEQSDRLWNLANLPPISGIIDFSKLLSVESENIFFRSLWLSSLLRSAERLAEGGAIPSARSRPDQGSQIIPRSEAR